MQHYSPQPESGNSPDVHQEMNKQAIRQSACSVKYYLALEDNEVLTRAVIWMKTEKATLNERSKTQRVTYRMISFMFKIQNRSIHMDRTQSGAFQRQRGKGNGEQRLNRYGVSFWGDDNVGVGEGFHWSIISNS